MDNETWECKIRLRVVVRSRRDETGESVPHGPPAGHVAGSGLGLG